MPPKVLDSVSGSVQPLVFETGNPEYPYATKGTVFFVGFAGRAFVLTARHALNPQDISPLCIFPNDLSQKIIPLKDLFYVSEDDVPDDFGDVVVIEIDMGRITNPEISQAKLINLALASGDWISRAETAEMFVIGYPVAHSFVDYPNQTITNHRWALGGRYRGDSEIEYLHKLMVSEANAVSTFDGFSGGPVFAWYKLSKGRGEIALCGMVLRGSISSKLIHFLDRSVLIGAIMAKINKT